MKSKNKKIQIFMKGIAIILVMMFALTPIVFATSSLDDNNLEGSFLDKLLYGTIGSTAKEIEEYLTNHTTLYISNERQLRALAEYVNNGHDCSGKEIILMNNIVLDTLQEWVPIGRVDTPFRGTFDGKGYTISGLNFNRNNKLYSEISYVGLFGYVQNGIIKNITLSNSKFNIPYDASKDILNSSDDIKEFTGTDFNSRYFFLGGIVGQLSRGTIENCIISDDVVVTGMKYVGGIVGSNSAGQIIDCTNNGIVSGFTGVGGIAGGNYGNTSIDINLSNILDFSNSNVGKIINCKNGKSATIYGLVGAVGGVAGSLMNNAIIQKSVNYGEVKVSTEIISVNVGGKIESYDSQNVGGIAGYVSGGVYDSRANYVAIDGCINFGKVQGYRDVGGIAGQLGGLSGGYAILKNSINYSLDVKAFLTTGNRESGYLAGELTTSGQDGTPSTEDDSITITYNNLYLAELEKDSISKDMEHTLAYGYNPIKDNYFDTETKIIIKDDNGKNAIATFDDSGKTELLEMSKYKFTDDNYKQIATQTNSNSSVTIENSKPIKVSIDSNYLYVYDSEIDGFNININGEQIVDSTTATTVRFEIYKNDEKNVISGTTYFKAGDKVKIKAIFNKYLTSSWGSSETLITAPKLTLLDKDNNKIEITSGDVEGNKYTNTIITYEYLVKDGDNINVSDLKLSKTGTIYAMNSSTEHPSFSGISIQADVSDLYFDTVAPIINTKVYVENALETGRYTVGKEVLIKITTSEAIQGNYTTPMLQISFSESGVGKYNYTKEPETVGYAKCIDAIINIDGTTTWTYTYQIQERDEGNLQLEYKAGEITDLAGNTTNIKDLYTPQTPSSSNISGGSWNKELGVTYEFYKNSVSEENKITSNTYFTKEDDLIVVANFDKVLYVHYGLSDGKNTNVRLTADDEYNDRAPSLYLNGNSNLKNTSTAVTTKENSTIITYTFNTEEYDLTELTNVDKLILKNENNTETVSTNGTTVTTNGLIPFAEEWYDQYLTEQEGQYKTIASNAINTTTDIKNIILDPVGVSNKIEQDDIYADTTSPTVEITIKDEDNIVDTITNKDTLTYEFQWSEEVAGFTKEDIKVTNGTVETFEGPDENNLYTATIKTTISTGNIGNMEVVIEQDACKDLVGYSNVRNAKTITIDKIAPILISLEAYASSNINTDENVDTVKEYYKVGDTVTIIATFSENIENTEKLPILTLQFSDSGNAKGTVNAGTKEGNKITYTYNIADGDAGTLSVKGFSGKVIDKAGNETIVTKRELNGDTIIADTLDPILEGITVIAPEFEYDDLLLDPSDTKRYGITSKTRENNTITFITSYNEDIYYLDTDTLQRIDDNNKPTLTFKFGTGTERTAVFSKVVGNEIYYTYDINSGDNGDLGNIKINGKISDKAGNETTLTVANKVPELYEDTITEENKVDKITADTTKPEFNLEATAVNKDDEGNTILGSGSYYRKGSNITITATTKEYIYENTNNHLAKFTTNSAPTLNVSFATSGTGTGNCTNVEYKENQTIFTYSYTIKENDNGILNLSIDELQGYDIALNGNNLRAESDSTINADTIRPHYEDQPGIAYAGNKYTVEFNEDLYYLDDNNIVRTFGDIDKAPKLKFEGKDTEYEPTISKNIISYSGEYVNAKPYLSASRLCDIAGNLYSYYDQEAPMLSNITVTSPESGTYMAGTEITIVATFNEKVTGTAPILKLKFGETSAQGTVSRGTIKDNTITYTYTITTGDNGVLGIESFTGTGLKDEYDNVWVAPESIELSGSKVIADTISPTVTITSDVEQTNKDTVIYTFTWSENVVGFTSEDIEVTNGSKGNFSGSGNVYTLEVDTTGEGRQIVKVNANVCTDIAGNPNEERTTYNQVVIDYTKPEIRAKVNGGDYVIDTDSQKSTLKETIVVNEEVSKFEYIWSQSATIPTTGFDTINPEDIQINSDIKLETQVERTGTYYLYIKVTDLAGNISIGKTNEFIVNEATITLTPNTIETTKEDVVVTVEYGEGLIQERKAGVQGKTQSADATKVIIEENGIVYAEAKDVAGNRVYATLEITNIDKTEQENPDIPPVEEDKTAPEITFNYTTTTATVGTTIGATITTNEDAIISYSWDNKNWTSSSEYVRSQKVVKTPNVSGTYTLYAKAIDKASNQTQVSKLIFTVVDNEEDIKNPEIIFEDLTTIQKDGTKYVKISPSYTSTMLTEKMDKDALLGKTPVYENLTSSNGLKTGSEIKIDGDTKYIVIVNGDVNCDGEVTPIDITMANSIRLSKANVDDVQILAADYDTSGNVEAIDITMINSYRLGKIKGI